MSFLITPGWREGGLGLGQRIRQGVGLGLGLEQSIRQELGQGLYIYKAIG